MRPIHVGILLSYDYQYLPICLSSIYKSSDKITLAIDKQRLTWNGKKYAFDEGFLKEILANDPDHKISVYEDDFAIKDLPPIECEKRERRMLRDFMQMEAEDAWHLQIDTDEYFVDFDGFVTYLHQIEKHYNKNITVYPRARTIFKIDSHGLILAIDDGERGYFPVASVGGCRFLPAQDEIILKVPFYVLHQSWGRTDEEIKFKIENWGHTRDFDTNAYYEFWKSVNKYNAKYIRDCHPLRVTSGWNRLKYEEGSINEVLIRLKTEATRVNFKPSVIKRAQLSKWKREIFSSKLAKLVKPIINYVIGKR